MLPIICCARSTCLLPNFPIFGRASCRSAGHPSPRKRKSVEGLASISKNWLESCREAVILLGPCETPLDTFRIPALKNLSLTEVADELRRCRLFIGNDSGITHIAAYWGTPTVALFGADGSSSLGTVGRRVKVLKRPSLADISVDDVRKLL